MPAAPDPERLTLRLAALADLTAIVAIYNASIPGQRSTADLEPVTVESRMAWFVMHDGGTRPIWVAEATDGEIAGWLSFSDYYGRPAYRTTVEIGVYIAPWAQGLGVGPRLVQHAIDAAPGFDVRTLLWITFAHNEASLRVAQRFGFQPWGLLPKVTELGGVRRDISILGLELAEPAEAAGGPEGAG